MRWIILLITLAAFLSTGITMYHFPEFANMASDFLWSLAGEAPVTFISRGAEIAKQVLSIKNVDASVLSSYLLRMFSTEIISALLMGSSIFILKSIFTRFNRNYVGSLLYPKWFLTLLGVALGVGLNSLIGTVAPEVPGELLKAGLTIGFMLLGIGIMLGFKGRQINPFKKSHRRFRIAHLGYITKLVLGVVGNAFNAILAVTCACGYMIGPAQIHSGNGYITSWIELLSLCLVLMWVFDIIIMLIGDLAEGL